MQWAYVTENLNGEENCWNVLYKINTKTKS